MYAALEFVGAVVIAVVIVLGVIKLSTLKFPDDKGN